MKMNLTEYKGKMGRLVDAGALLKSIDQSGRPMRLPNIYLAPEESLTLTLSNYNITEATEAQVASESIATVSLEGDKLTIKAVGEGQTSLTIKSRSGDHYATITVRNGASDNGWL